MAPEKEISSVLKGLDVINYIKHKRPCLTTFPNTEKGVATMEYF